MRNLDKLYNGTQSRIIDNCDFVKNIFEVSTLHNCPYREVDANPMIVSIAELSKKSFTLFESHDQLFELITGKPADYSKRFGENEPFIHTLRGLRHLQEHSKPL